MKLSIRHETRYRFDQPIPYALQRARLTPMDVPGQKVLSWTIEPEGAVLEAEHDDAHGNRVSLFRGEEDTQSIALVCGGVIETDPAFQGITGQHRGYVPLWLFREATALTKPGAGIAALAGRIKAAGAAGDIALLHALSAEIGECVEYEVGATESRTTAEEAVKLGRGVCQDHAHIFIAAARHLGYPARYVSGYLFMDDKSDQEAGHAWAEAHVDGLGWVGFDISNGISPDERYVRVASGRDYADAAPVLAMAFAGGEHDMSVSLDIGQ